MGRFGVLVCHQNSRFLSDEATLRFPKAMSYISGCRKIIVACHSKVISECSPLPYSFHKMIGCRTSDVILAA
jgi:hypothetical protein